MDFMEGPLSGQRIGWRVAVNGSVSKRRPVTGGIPQGLVLGLVMFNSFVSNREMHGAVNMLERRDGIQRDMENLERWGYVNHMMFNKFKGMVLHKSIPSTGWSKNVEIMLQIFAGKSIPDLSIG